MTPVASSVEVYGMIVSRLELFTSTTSLTLTYAKNLIIAKFEASLFGILIERESVQDKDTNLKDDNHHMLREAQSFIPSNCARFTDNEQSYAH